MATLTLTFDLSDPDDAAEAYNAVTAQRTKWALEEIVEELRKMTKYDACNYADMEEGESAGLYKARDIINEILSDNGVKLD